MHIETLKNANAKSLIVQNALNKGLPFEKLSVFKKTSSDLLILCRIVLINGLCAVFLVCGCVSKETSYAGSDPVIIAKLEAAKRGWHKVQVGNPRLENNRWLVPVWMIPATPECQAVVEIAKDGKVIAFKGFLDN